ncbi:MAG TPA: hypothetical protein VM733_03460 [Thermoanaerobaculia bacterium]|nr:hypothetical protein [Thermoanaerobaculia bacterium]
MPLRAQHPDEPWLWRRDWMDRTIRQSPALGGACLLGFTILWNLFAIPIGIFLVRWRWPMDARTILLAAFPISGALLILLALYAAARRWRYGVSTCRIERSPIPLGTTLRGELDVRLREAPPQGFALRLASVRREIRGSGKDRSEHETILWQDEQTLEHGLMPSAIGMRVPFRFDIPHDAPPCDFTDPRNTVLWKLYASAAVPGIDYEAEFELPVFRVEGSQDEIADRPLSAFSWQPPPEVSLTPDSITIRSSARLADVVSYVIFFTLWYGALYLIRQLGAPLWVVLFFALFGFAFVLFAFDFVFGRTHLTATRSLLKVRRTWLGIGPPARVLPSSAITALAPKLGVSVGNRAYHAVVATLATGSTRGIARYLRTRHDAEMLAARVGEMMGL